MYSRHNIAVDKGVAMEQAEKGLGFDFSAIGDMVKGALPGVLNIYSQQMQLKQVKAMKELNMSGGFVAQQPGAYGQGYGQTLPFSTAMQGQPTFGGQQPYYQQSSGISTTTMLSIGAAAVIGLLAFKMLR